MYLKKYLSLQKNERSVKLNVYLASRLDIFAFHFIKKVKQNISSDIYRNINRKKMRFLLLYIDQVESNEYLPK